MRKYEVSREIYNPCAGIYTFDNNFFREVETDDIEMQNLKTGVIDTDSNFVHDFLYELIEANPEILKNMDSKK